RSGIAYCGVEQLGTSRQCSGVRCHLSQGGSRATGLQEHHMLAALTGMADCGGESAAIARAFRQDRNAAGTWIFRDVVDAVGKIDVEFVAGVDHAARPKATPPQLGDAEY